ncbi:MAG: acetate--CoA ligase family protein [Chloroflexi bacterium]|nr:acetate--CoA ligase family protein [Chloroflexota bacterium]
MQATNLDPVFRPQSVAIVGASNDPYKWGYLLLDNLLQSEFAGPVYPVNPHAAQIHDRPAYPRLTDVPDPVDLAIVAVPAAAVPGVVADAASAGVRAAMIVTAGLAEPLDLTAARRAGMRVVGPHCLGVHSAAARFSALMIPAPLAPGPVAFVSQSGGYGIQLFVSAQRQRVGIGTFVNTGDETDLTSTDYLAYLGADPDVRAVIMYLQDVHPAEGPRFIDVARQVTREKPVIAIKLRRSPRPDALDADAMWDAALQQAGVLRARDPDQLLDYARALSRLPLPRGRRVGILTRTGGAGAEAADRCDLRGLEMPPLSSPVVDQLRELLPPYAGVDNPVDVIGLLDPGPYNEALRLMLGQDDIDALIALGIVQMSPEELGERYTWISAIYNGLLEANLISLVGQFRRTGKPIVVESATGVSGRNQKLLDEAGIPVYAIPERAVDALAALARYRELREQVQAWEPRTRPPGPARSEAVGLIYMLWEQGRRALAETQAKGVLGAYGVPVAEGAVAHSAADAVALAQDYGFPVVIKVVSPDIARKARIGGVKVGVRNSAAVRRAYEEILENAALHAPGAAIEGVLVQRMAAPGRQMRVGLTRHAQLGSAIHVGPTGGLTDDRQDGAWGIVPLIDDEARRMIAGLHAYPVLAGHALHQDASADLDALNQVILALNDLALDCPTIATVDIDPFFLYDAGYGGVAVDASITLS